MGKSPLAAAICLLEAAGPSLFDGWAVEGDVYRCAEHGCPCGYEYVYEAGEAKAIPRHTTLVQLVATSEQQVENVFAPMQAMVRNGPLAATMNVRENFIRVGDRGKIDVVTASATSRLGQQVTFSLFEESGLYVASNKMLKVANTVRRGAAGMQGRTLEVTNCPDPSEGSYALQTMESKSKDIFKYWPQAPLTLSAKNKRDRRKILEIVYAGAGHIDLDSIEAECAELMQTHPAEAERFYLNRIVAGTGAWLDPAAWSALEAPRTVPDGTRVVLAFDGSDTGDHTGFRAETLDNYQFTPRFGSDQRKAHWNPADHGGQVPRLEVAAALDEFMRRYDVALVYADVPFWESEIDAWSEKYGERKVIRWHTRRVNQMHEAAEQFRTDVMKADTPLAHDGCEITAQHIGNVRTSARPGDRYALGKPSRNQKIDMAIPSILAHAAASDLRAAGKAVRKRSYFISA